MITILLFAFAMIIGYCIMMIWNAYDHTRRSEHTPAFECPKHGIIPESAIMQLDTQGLTQPISTCPFCFSEKMAAAKKGILGR